MLPYYHLWHSDMAYMFRYLHKTNLKGIGQWLGPYWDSHGETVAGHVGTQFLAMGGCMTSKSFVRFKQLVDRETQRWLSTNIRLKLNHHPLYGMGECLLKERMTFPFIDLR